MNGLGWIVALSLAVCGCNEMEEPRAAPGTFNGTGYDRGAFESP